MYIDIEADKNMYTHFSIHTDRYHRTYIHTYLHTSFSRFRNHYSYISGSIFLCMYTYIYTYIIHVHKYKYTYTYI
jgi:hypothetical protein